MSHWRETTLGALATEAGGFVRTGPFGSQLHAHEYTDDPDGVPVVMPKDMINGRVDRSSVSRVESAIANRLAVHRLTPGDVVLARRGDIGRYAFVADDENGWLCGTGSLRVHAPDHDVVSPDFFRYALGSSNVTNWLLGQAIGATMPNLNASIVANVPLRLPDPKAQRRIGAALSAFDDLIAINERRIELLENLVRSLYREWFVRLRHPGAEADESGEIPDGWEVGTVGRFLEVIGGGTPSKAEPRYWEDGSVDWYTPSDLTRARRRYAHHSADRVTELGVQRSSARKFPAGSVLMTSRATLGVLAIATAEATTNQGFIVIPPVDGLPPTFVYEWLAEHEEELAAIATGATFKEITKGAFKRFVFIKPSPTVLSEFRETVSPLESQIRTLEEATAYLTSTRDLLLPRLVTGQLDISDVDLGDLLTEDEA